MLKNKLLSSILIILSFSCSNKFIKDSEIKDYKIQQVLKVKFIDSNETQSFNVYTLLNREKQIALLNGVGSFNKHIFKLKIEKDNFYFFNYINNIEEKGKLSNFSFLNLNKKLIFEEIDIENKQPIIIKKDDKKLIILVKEQSSL